VTRVLERVEVKPERVELKARYVVYGSHDPAATPLLVAELEGVQEATVASLSGPVLEGWLAGSRLRSGSRPWTAPRVGSVATAAR